MAFGYILGAIAGIMEDMDGNSDEVKENMEMVKQYVYYRKIPKELGKRLTNYMRFYYMRSSAVLDEKLLFQVSVNIPCCHPPSPPHRHDFDLDPTTYLGTHAQLAERHNEVSGESNSGKNTALG